MSNITDPVSAAQDRLEQAVERLEAALAARGKGGKVGAAQAALSLELERVRAENAALQAARRAARERLDTAIDRLKGLIES